MNFSNGLESIKYLNYITKYQQQQLASSNTLVQFCNRKPVFMNFVIIPFKNNIVLNCLLVLFNIFL